MFFFTTHSVHFVHRCVTSDVCVVKRFFSYLCMADTRKDGNVLFNDALNTFYGYVASDICLRTTELITTYV